MGVQIYTHISSIWITFWGEGSANFEYAVYVRPLETFLEYRKNDVWQKKLHMEHA